MEAMRQAKRDRELEVIEWEKMLMKEPSGEQMRAMWEVRQYYLALMLGLDCYELHS